MCLFSYSKRLKINIFSKTVYKIVYIEGDKAISYYQNFKYRFNKTYKIPQETILDNRFTAEFTYPYRKIYTFEDGFYSYSKREFVSSTIKDGVLVKCRIPAFSRIVYNLDKTEILSNKIKILKICH